MTAYAMCIPDPLMKMAIEAWAEDYCDGKWAEKEDGIIFLDETDAAIFAISPEYELLLKAGSTELVAFSI